MTRYTDISGGLDFAYSAHHYAGATVHRGVVVHRFGMSRSAKFIVPMLGY